MIWMLRRGYLCNDDFTEDGLISYREWLAIHLFEFTRCRYITLKKVSGWQCHHLDVLHEQGHFRLPNVYEIGGIWYFHAGLWWCSRYGLSWCKTFLALFINDTVLNMKALCFLSKNEMLVSLWAKRMRQTYVSQVLRKNRFTYNGLGDWCKSMRKIHESRMLQILTKFFTLLTITVKYWTSLYK